MAKIGVSPDEWTRVVTAAKQKVTNLSAIKKIGVKKTTLSRFKKFNGLGEDWNKLQSSYASYGASRTDLMNKMGEKIVSDDKQYATQFDKSKNYTRFSK